MRSWQGLYERHLAPLNDTVTPQTFTFTLRATPITSQHPHNSSSPLTLHDTIITPLASQVQHYLKGLQMAVATVVHGACHGVRGPTAKWLADVGMEVEGAGAPAEFTREPRPPSL